MVNLIRNNTPYAVLLLLIFTILLQSASFHGALPADTIRVPVYHLFVLGFRKLFGASTIGWIFFHTLLVFLQAIYLNSIVLKNRLLPKSTFTPAFVYLVFTAANPEFRGIPQALIANFFLLGALDAMLQFGQPTQPRRQIFNAGFLIGIAAFVQFSYIFAFLLLIMALVFLRPFHPGEYISAFMGLITPVYFVASVLFLYDGLPALLRWPQLSFHLPLLFKSPLVSGLLIAGFSLLPIAGLFQLQKLMNRSTIYVRRAWGTIVSGALAALIIALSASPQARGTWMVLAPFFALAATPVLETEKPRWFATFAFWLALLLALVCRFILS